MTPLPQRIDFHQELLQHLGNVASSSHLTEGRYTQLLEEAVSKHTGLYAVAVNSCGSGLFALYRLLDAKRALVPTNTFYATGGMAREAGYDIELVDVAPDRFSVGLAQIEKARRYGTRLVVLTHVGGKLADQYMEIAEYCTKNNLLLIEDAAHTLGVPGVGLLGDAAVFSLYPTKAVPAGEGGVIVTKHKAVADELRVFRNYGKQTVEGTIRYTRGFNLRMDEWTAAVSYVQMRRISEIMELRQEAASRLEHVLKPHPEFRGAVSNWYKYPVYRRDAEALGFEKRTGSIYQVSDQLTAAMYGRPPLPNAEKLADDHVCLPMGEGLYENKSGNEIAAWLRGEVS